MRLEDAAAHHRPAGLVIVDIRRVDYGDVEVRFTAQKTGSRRDARRAAADNHHIELSIRISRWSLAAIGDPPRNACR